MLRSRRIGAMRDVELHRALLGLTAPWTVMGADMDLASQQVVVRGRSYVVSAVVPERGG